MDQVEAPWSPEEDEMLLNLIEEHGVRRWSIISESIPGRSTDSCDLRWLSLCQSFTPEEDEMLQNHVQKHGPNWSLIGKSIPGKSDQSCRLRRLSLQLSFTPEEDQMLDELVFNHSSNWSLISKSIPGKSAKICELRWDIVWIHRMFPNLMTNEDITIGGLKPPPSFSDIIRGKGSSYIQDGDLSHEVGGASGHKAPSISDMLRVNMSVEGTHSYSRVESAPSWSDLNKQDSSTMMIDGDNVQDSVGWGRVLLERFFGGLVKKPSTTKVMVTNDN